MRVRQVKALAFGGVLVTLKNKKKDLGVNET